MVKFLEGGRVEGWNSGWKAEGFYYSVAECCK